MADQSTTAAFGVDGVGHNASAWASTVPRRPIWISSPVHAVLSLLCLHSALFLTFAADRLDMRAFVSLHLALCAATATVGAWWVKRPSAVLNARDKTAVMLQLVGCTLIAGPFGAAIAGALLVPQRAQANHAEDAADGAAVRPNLTRLELLHSSLLDKRLRLERVHNIRPLLDVIIEGTQTERLHALSLICKRYDPAMAPTLKRALEDKDGSVRVLAAKVIAQQHDVHTRRIGASQAAARAAPEILSHWRDLGRAHLEYAESGLLEASRAGAEARQARDHLARGAGLDLSNDVAGTGLDAARQFDAFARQQAVSASEFHDGDKHPVRSDDC